MEADDEQVTQMADVTDPESSVSGRRTCRVMEQQDSRKENLGLVTGSTGQGANI